MADAPASAAAAFTANRVTAAPLIVDKEHLRATGGKVRVVAINAGNANCAAGQAGLDAARATCTAAAEIFACPPEEVFPSSTGIIGVPLPAEKLIAALAQLWPSPSARSPTIFSRLPQAILTTDTVEKTAFARIERSTAKEVRIAASCKGSGMIHPQLVPHATMLVYILTDAAVEPAVLDSYLRKADRGQLQPHFGGWRYFDQRHCAAAGFRRERRRHRRGQPGICRRADPGVHLAGPADRGRRRGHHPCGGIAHQGAATDADALRVAKAIAHSPLVKTAWAGCDPNWGRLVAAIGYSGAQIDPDRIDIWFGELPICRDGGRAAEFDEAAAHAYIPQREFSITIQLHQGSGSCVFWTTDLTHEYIHINADYST